MAQQFDDLHTGQSGIEVTFGNEQPAPAQEEAISEQQRELAELLPGVDAIKKVLDEEINTVSDIRAYITTLGAKADVSAIQDEYRARELYIGLMQRLKTSIDDKVLSAQESVR